MGNVRLATLLLISYGYGLLWLPTVISLEKDTTPSQMVIRVVQISPSLKNPRQFVEEELSVPGSKVLVLPGRTKRHRKGTGSKGRLDVETKSQKVVLQCAAPYPVQWIYSGDGFPEIVTNTSFVQNPFRSDAREEAGVFVASAGLGYGSAPITESATGEYICKRVQIASSPTPSESGSGEHYFHDENYASIYIFVPGKSLFTSPIGGILKVAAEESWVRVPCSVSHPDVLVTLQKREPDGIVQCPTAMGSMKFTPEAGFTLHGHPHFTLFGRYICVGSIHTKNGTVFQQVEYSVIPSDVVTSPMNEQSQENVPEKRGKIGILGTEHHDYVYSEGDINNDRFRGFLPDEAISIEDWGDEDYEDSSTDDNKSDDISNNEDACYPSNPCGPNSVCKTKVIRIPGGGSSGSLFWGGEPWDQHRQVPTKSVPRCTCLPSYIGRPPNCRPECILHMDCPSAMGCIHQRCSDPCLIYPCGENARCQVKKHRPKCFCPEGFVGDPNEGGKCGKLRAPFQGYFPPPPPANSAGVSHNNKYRKFPCDPWPCGPNSECMPVGREAHCSCSKGFIGVPPNCRAECHQDTECPHNLACVESRCRDACSFRKKCGVNADCRTERHRGECYCPSGYHGDPVVQCFANRIPVQAPPHNHMSSPRPAGHDHRPSTIRPSSSSPMHNMHQQIVMIMTKPSGAMGGHPISFPSSPDSSSSSGPCSKSHNSPCGRNAICSHKNHSILGCHCPPAFRGPGSDPYVECRPSHSHNDDTSSSSSLSSSCEACGPYSKCVLVNGRPPAKCSCLPGKEGSPPHCHPREDSCHRNTDCPDHQHCHKGACEDPCSIGVCGKFAVCRAVSHRAVCACPHSPGRDPFEDCPPPHPQQTTN